MGKTLKDVIAYAGWCPEVALVAIRRGWMGDYWVARETPNDEWVFHGAYVTDAQKKILHDVYGHARTACELREKCTTWCKNHPGWKDDGYVIPHDIVCDLRSIEEEQGLADDGLEDALSDHPELVEWAKSNPANNRI